MTKDTNDKLLAIVYSDQGKFLLLKTNPKTMKLDRWYVVTGSIKDSESEEEAVKREIEEETHLEIMKIKSTSVVYNYEWPEGSGIWKREKVFLVKVRYGEPKITKWEHLDWKWLNKRDFINEIYWYGESKNKLRELIKDA